ncbi:hypothetical protein OF83DRAFT_814993 [Amylostereum chailletii]|nr:hypothetical protein OF83DRAFT_814993 [Amylostereum chailletii]
MYVSRVGWCALRFRGGAGYTEWKVRPGLHVLLLGTRPVHGEQACLLYPPHRSQSSDCCPRERFSDRKCGGRNHCTPPACSLVCARLGTSRRYIELSALFYFRPHSEPALLFLAPGSCLPLMRECRTALTEPAARNGSQSGSTMAGACEWRSSRLTSAGTAHALNLTQLSSHPTILSVILADDDIAWGFSNYISLSVVRQSPGSRTIASSTGRGVRILIIQVLR